MSEPVWQQVIGGRCENCADRRCRCEGLYRRAVHGRLLNEPGWIESRYIGTCAGCGKQIAAGTPIHRDSRGPFGQWIGACCADVLDD